MKTEEIQKLYHQAQIDYEVLYFKLWLALIGWAKNSITKEKEREIVDHLKQSEKLLNSFNKARKREEITQDYMVNLGFSLKKNPLINSRKEEISFKSVEVNFNDYKTGCWGSESEDLSFWFSFDDKAVFQILIEVLYQIRCNLFHGKFYEENNSERVKTLIYSYHILNSMLSCVI